MALAFGRIAKLATGVLAVILTLVACEVGLRIYHSVQATSKPRSDAAPSVPLHIITNGPTFYELNPAHPDISKQGTRDDEVAIPKPPNTLRILVLGDSIAYGNSVAMQKTFPNELERLLRTQFASVDVINAGVSGYGPYNELQYYLTRADQFEPDVVIVAFCMNDVVNPRLHWGDAPNAKIPNEAIPNLDYDRNHVQPKLQRQREEAEQRSRHDQQHGLLEKSELYKAIKPALDSVFRKQAAKPVTSSGTPTYLTAEDDISIEVLLDRRSPEWRWLAAMYDRLHTLISAKRQQMVMVIFPLAYQMDDNYPFFPQRQLADYCKENSIPCLDLLPSFKQHRKEDLFMLDREGRADVWHLTEYGHAVTAQELLRFLQAQKVLTPLK